MSWSERRCAVAAVEQESEGVQTYMICELSFKEWIDISLAAASLLVAIVAIIVSVSTAKKQNSITLFNLRYEAITYLRKMIVYGAQIQGELSETLIKMMYDGMFGTRIVNANDVEAVTQILSTTEVIEKSSLAQDWASDSEMKEIRDLTYSLQNLLLHVVRKDGYAEIKTAYCKACEDFYNGTYLRLRSKIKL